MFESLSDRLGGVFDRLTKQGALTEDDVTAAMREVRQALLDADVSLPVVRNFVRAVTAKATGAAVTKSITPGQQVVKIVHDELIRTLQGEDAPETLKIDTPPAPILMVGLQGSGKTTTTAKLAKRLKDREKKRVLMASLDTNRPAAMEQLAILGQQVGVEGHGGGGRLNESASPVNRRRPMERGGRAQSFGPDPSDLGRQARRKVAGVQVVVEWDSLPFATVCDDGGHGF